MQIRPRSRKYCFEVITVTNHQPVAAMYDRLRAARGSRESHGQEVKLGMRILEREFGRTEQTVGQRKRGAWDGIFTSE